MLTCQKTKANFYIPISLVDENFKRANLNNAATEQKFYTRTNVFDNGKPIIKELTLKEILGGCVRIRNIFNFLTLP
jgi:glutamate--cysteine ligase catalytic subunit